MTEKKEMTQEEKKRQFEENIVTLAVQEYYKYVDEKKLVRSEEDSKMFYEVFRMGIYAGVNYATNQYIKSLKNFEEQKQQGENDE
jgi:transposase-like protein